MTKQLDNEGAIIIERGFVPAGNGFNSINQFFNSSYHPKTYYSVLIPIKHMKKFEAFIKKLS